MEVLKGITTKDVLAVLVVAATLIFNGISLVSGKPLDAATVGLAGIVVGHYFRNPDGPLSIEREEPLARPSYGGDE